jgi:DNA polymerase-3 subunit chi
MPEVAFHTGIADKGGYVCRLLRKAYRQGRQVVVTGESGQLDRLDLLLWTFEQTDFVPHLRMRAADAPATPLRRTPIWIADEPAQAQARDVLVNLGPGWPEGFADFARVIEIVGDEAEDVASGRERWRRYRAAGAEPTHARAPASGSP